MAFGDVVETKRTRYEDNERFDEVDAQAEGELRLVREAMMIKSLLAGMNFASGVGRSVGLVLQGGSLTGSAGPGTVTLGAELFIALDADGNLMIKSAATGAITTSVPGGQSTVYAYAADAGSDLDVRAFIPAVAPFTEFTRSINTRFVNLVGLIAITGDATVNNAVINGSTKPLVAIALVNNVAGTVTITNFYANVLQAVPAFLMPQITPTILQVGTPGVTNYSYLIVGKSRGGSVTRQGLVVPTATGNAALSGVNYNQLSWTPDENIEAYDIYRTVGGATQGKIGTVVGFSAGPVAFNDTGLVGDGSVAPTDTFGALQLPANSTDRASSLNTLVALAQSAISMIADAKWKQSSSTFTTAQNYGAYSPLRNGIDKVDRDSPEGTVVTIGDGINTFGTYDTTNFANADAMLAQIIADVAASGSTFTTVLVKGGTYTFTANAQLPNNLRFRSFASYNNLATNILGLRGTPLFVLSGMTLTCGNGNQFDDIGFYTNNGGSLVLNSYTKLSGCRFENNSGAAQILPMITNPSLTPVNFVEVIGCDFECESTFVGYTNNQIGMFEFGSQVTNLKMRDCIFHANVGSTVMFNFFTATSGLMDSTITDCTFFAGLSTDLDPANAGNYAPMVDITGTVINRNTLIKGCRFLGTDLTETIAPTIPSLIIFSSTFAMGLRLTDAPFMSIVDCTFDRVGSGMYYNMDSTNSSRSAPLELVVDGCTFSNMGLETQGILVQQTSATPNMTIYGVRIINNYFYQLNGTTEAVFITGNSSVTLENIVIEGNNFTGGGGGGGLAVGLGGNTIQNVRLNNNMVADYNLAAAFGSGIFSVFVQGVANINHMEVCGNTFHNINGQEANEKGTLFGIADGGGGAVTNITHFTFSNNTVRNVTGQAISANSPLVGFSVGGAITHFEACNNTFSQIHTNLTNVASSRKWVFTFLCNSTMRHFVIEGNTVGDTTSQIGLVNIAGLSAAANIQDIKICENSITYLETRGTVSPLDVVILIGGSGGQNLVYGMIDISDNSFHLVDTTGAGQSAVDVIQVGNNVLNPGGAVKCNENQFLYEGSGSWNAVGMFVKAATAQTMTVYNQAAKCTGPGNAPAAGSGFTFSGAAAVGATNQV